MVKEHHQLNGHESEKTPGDSGGQRSLACCSPWGHKESGMSWRLNSNSPTRIVTCLLHVTGHSQRAFLIGNTVLSTSTCAECFLGWLHVLGVIGT